MKSKKQELTSPHLKSLEKELDKIERAESYLEKEKLKLKKAKERNRIKIRKEKEVIRLEKQISRVRNRKK
jgi:hypothetical protein